MQGVVASGHVGHLGCSGLWTCMQTAFRLFGLWGLGGGGTCVFRVSFGWLFFLRVFLFWEAGGGGGGADGFGLWLQVLGLGFR